MSATTAAFPITLAERLELGLDIVRIPASWEEYLDLLEQADFQVEYDIEPEIHVLHGKLSVNTNPWLVVEVLSPSTFVRNMKEKLPAYKKISSLRHILYIHQDRPLVTLMNRVGESAVWETIDYDRLEDSFSLAGRPVYLRDIYRKVKFEPESPKGKRSSKKK